MTVLGAVTVEKRLAAIVAAVFAVAVLLSGCGGGKSNSSYDGSASYCPAANSYAWWHNYLGGQYGGPPTDAAGAVQAADSISTALHQLQKTVPSSQAKNVAALVKTWTYVSAFYKRNQSSMTQAKITRMQQNAPRSITQGNAFGKYVTKHCSAGNAWPTKPADARPQRSSLHRCGDAAA